MRNEHATSNARILLVEDNPDDVFIFRKALKRFQLNWDLHVADGANAAIDFLSHKNHLPPNLIVTALLMRECPGYDLIAWVRTHPTLKYIPILVLSDTPDPRDCERALQLGANHFVEKTPSMGNAVLQIRQFLDDCHTKAGGAHPSKK